MREDSLGKQGRSWTQLCPETCELARETVSAFQLGVELDLPLVASKNRIWNLSAV